METPLTLLVPELLYHLNCTDDQFQRARRKLKELDFPDPLPGFGTLRWSRRQVTDWINNGGSMPELVDDRPADVFAQEGRELEESLAGGRS